MASLHDERGEVLIFDFLSFEGWKILCPETRRTCWCKISIQCEPWPNRRLNWMYQLVDTLNCTCRTSRELRTSRTGNHWGWRGRSCRWSLHVAGCRVCGLPWNWDRWPWQMQGKLCTWLSLALVNPSVDTLEFEGPRVTLTRGTFHRANRVKSLTWDQRTFCSST